MALGLHPLNAARARETDITTFASLMSGARYIGEVGLDRSPDGAPTWDRQVQVLERLLAMPGATTKLWSVHSRRAESTAVPMLIDARVPTVLHWYTGSIAMLERALAAGFYFSVNLAMLSSTSGQRILGAIPRDRILTETDAPYVRSRQPNDPASSVRDLVSALAGRWSVSLDEARSLVFENMARAAAASTDLGRRPVDEASEATPGQATRAPSRPVQPAS